MNLNKKLIKERSKKAHVRATNNERLVAAEVKEKTKGRAKTGGYEGKKWYPEISKR